VTALTFCLCKAACTDLLLRLYAAVTTATGAIRSTLTNVATSRRMQLPSTDCEVCSGVISLTRVSLIVDDSGYGVMSLNGDGGGSSGHDAAVSLMVSASDDGGGGGGNEDGNGGALMTSSTWRFSMGGCGLCGCGLSLSHRPWSETKMGLGLVGVVWAVTKACDLWLTKVINGFRRSTGRI